MCVSKQSLELEIETCINELINRTMHFILNARHSGSQRNFVSIFPLRLRSNIPTLYAGLLLAVCFCSVLLLLLLLLWLFLFFFCMFNVSDRFFLCVLKFDSSPGLYNKTVSTTKYAQIHTIFVGACISYS